MTHVKTGLENNLSRGRPGIQTQTQPFSTTLVSKQHARGREGAFKTDGGKGREQGNFPELPKEQEEGVSPGERWGSIQADSSNGGRTPGAWSAMVTGLERKQGHRTKESQERVFS